MVDEKALCYDVQEFFNEEDTSVGIYAVGRIDKDIAEEFADAFEGVEIVSWDKYELEFKIENDTYKVVLSESYGRWQMYRVIIL